MKQKIDLVTVVVPVKNEERNLPTCLAALERFAHIVVVDSGSTDRTKEIAIEFGAEFVSFDWNGKFPKKRNWMLRTYAFKTEWVLFIDADEIVNDAFCDALDRVLPTTLHVGFWLNYTNYFMGKKLNYGVPQRKLACFRTDAGEFERIEETNWSRLDMEIHEHPILVGSTGEITAKIDHRDFRGLARFLERHIDYARWEAARYLMMKSKARESELQLTRRQSLKYNMIESSLFSRLYFVYTYFVKLGILDGAAGYQFASYKRWYFQTVRNLIREQRRSDSSH